ncbi:hypothetical protein HAX54_045752 [Datura stramonium]|uniref:Uncharacterized protein n=1 Tax=Datura stramonium TaxID=4076 RepID=A0ABS8SRZ8_DATST|nr:hypothetical protein [Datura stramonium]
MNYYALANEYGLKIEKTDPSRSRTWSWFVELLKRSLDLKDRVGVTFISDMQKGLLNAVSNVLHVSHQRAIAYECTMNFNGDYGYEVSKGGDSKEVYLLTCKHKMYPVRGVQFSRVDPAHAMQPPEFIKLVGRPKKKRDKTTDEARKRKGE